MQRLFMRKNAFLSFLSMLAITGILLGCGGDKTPPLSERIAKAWTARIVTENNTMVYTRGGTSNVRPTYSNFKLDLSSAPTARYTAYDGNTFVGQYSVQDNPQTLTLTNLQPSPTGTNGTISFTISSISDTELVLTRNSADQKTGNSTNVYTLSNP
jgi:hypothetical protein